MGSEADQLLHFFFFPAMAPGHMLPMVDLAKLFASRGVRVTLILTPQAATSFRSSIARSAEAGHFIRIELIHFPAVPSGDHGLPPGRESMDQMSNKEEAGKFFAKIQLLEDPFRRLVSKLHPDCIVSDMFLPWTMDVAESFEIPRIVFSGSSYFAACATATVTKFSPEKSAHSDTEPFSLPGFPDDIKMTKAKLPDRSHNSPQFQEMWKRVQAAEAKNYGMVMNSFYDIEKNYIKHLQDVEGKKTWHVGPVSLCNQTEMKERGGKTSSVDVQTCLRWLDSKKRNSVLYICFGSMCRFSPVQMIETAAALEDLEVSFIWVVKNEEVLPEGFEERVAEKGLVIKGWAPQVLILGHGAVGGFVTHCGWNSVLEGLTFGLPMVTWPAFAEQFYNEKLLTEVLRVGVGVGVERWAASWEKETKEVVARGKIEEAVRRVMVGGEEEEGMRRRAKEAAEAARKAVAEGGSSYVELGRLIEEMEVVREKKRMG